MQKGYSTQLVFPQIPFPSSTLFSCLHSKCTVWDNAASIFIDADLRRTHATLGDPNSRQLCVRRIALMERHHIPLVLVFRNHSDIISRTNPYACLHGNPFTAAPCSYPVFNQFVALRFQRTSDSTPATHSEQDTLSCRSLTNISNFYVAN